MSFCSDKNCTKHKKWLFAKSYKFLQNDPFLVSPTSSSTRAHFSIREICVTSIITNVSGIYSVRASVPKQLRTHDFGCIYIYQFIE